MKKTNEEIHNFCDAIKEFKTSRPFCIELYFESNHGCPGHPEEWVEKLKHLSDDVNQLKAIKVIKHKIHNDKHLASIESPIYFIDRSLDK